MPIGFFTVCFTCSTAVPVCAGFVYLHHVHALLWVLSAQVHLEALAHPVKGKEVIKMQHTKVTAYIQQQWVTYWFSQSSFISRLTLLTAVSPAATSPAITIFSSVTLQNSQGKICGVSVSLQLANVRRQSMCAFYRWSSWSRIAKARSSTVSLYKEERNSQDTSETTLLRRAQGRCCHMFAHIDTHFWSRLSRLSSWSSFTRVTSGTLQYNTVLKKS